VSLRGSDFMVMSESCACLVPTSSVVEVRELCSMPRTIDAKDTMMCFVYGCTSGSRST